MFSFSPRNTDSLVVCTATGALTVMRRAQWYAFSSNCSSVTISLKSRQALARSRKW